MSEPLCEKKTDWRSRRWRRQKKLGHGGDGISRPGGRFWLVADSDDEEETLATGGETSLSASPTPSDGICRAFQEGFSEEEVAEIVDDLVPTNDPARQGLQYTDKIEIARRVARRRTAASSVRPWHGPLPKVSLPKLTLSDFFNSPWKIVTSKKQRRKAAVPSATACQISSANSKLLKGPLGLIQTKQIAQGMDSTSTGYMAQLRVQTCCNHKNHDVIDSVKSKTCAVTRVSRRQNCPGFPSAKTAGRARWIGPHLRGHGDGVPGNGAAVTVCMAGGRGNNHSPPRQGAAGDPGNSHAGTGRGVNQQFAGGRGDSNSAGRGGGGRTRRQQQRW
ncbi:Myosin-4 [Hordeum vulgare]|nr:Myosin-4 [Hordeum vulgare]